MSQKNTRPRRRESAKVDAKNSIREFLRVRLRAFVSSRFPRSRPALPPGAVSVLSVVQLLCFCFVAGCNSPSAANNKLRVENSKLQEQITALQREIQTDKATIQAREAMVGTLPTLPQERLDKLFTTGGIKLGRLTGGDPSSASKNGDVGIKVEVVPVDQQGEKLKAAGRFEIDAFDLAQPTDPQVGHWSFNVDEARQNWYGGGLLYSYVLKCPWQNKSPVHEELTLKVKFVDELTGREFTQQRVIKIRPLTTTP